MLINTFSGVEVGEIVIPVKNPLVSVMRVENNSVRVIKSDNKEFKIDELITTSGQCIHNPNLNIKVSIKPYGQIPIKTKFIYDDSIYIKVEIDTGGSKNVFAYKDGFHTIRNIFSSEDVFVIEEPK